MAYSITFTWAAFWLLVPWGRQYSRQRIAMRRYWIDADLGGRLMGDQRRKAHSVWTRCHWMGWHGSCLLRKRHTKVLVQIRPPRYCPGIFHLAAISFRYFAHWMSSFGCATRFSLAHYWLLLQHAWRVLPWPTATPSPGSTLANLLDFSSFTHWLGIAAALITALWPSCIPSNKAS